MVILDTDATYTLNMVDGSFEKLNDDGWGGAQAAVYGDGKAYVFHTHGIYCVNLDDGSSTKVNSDDDFGWGDAKSAIYLGNQTAVVFHNLDAYKVNLVDGSYKTFGCSTGWGGTKACTKVDDGKVLILHRDTA